VDTIKRLILRASISLECKPDHRIFIPLTDMNPAGS